MLGTRAIWHNGWKAATAVPAAPDSWGDFHQQRWELFDTDTDPSECHDLSEQHPEKLQELIALWWAEAGRYGALPLESRGAVEILTTERPAALQAALPLRLLPGRGGGAGVGRAEHPQPLVHDRAPRCEIETPEAGGVLFSQGSRFGGHALYVKDGRLKYVYNWIGELVQIVESDEPIPTGHVVLSASFEREGDTMPTAGHAHPAHPRRAGRRGHDHDAAGQVLARRRRASTSGGRRRAGHRRLRRRARRGRSSAARSSASSIDVSGEPFVDLAQEARAAFARQ